MLNDIEMKLIAGNGTVRVTVTRFSVRVEELPRKPCKKLLRSAHLETKWACSVAHCDDFIPANLMRDADLATSHPLRPRLNAPAMSFDEIVERLKTALFAALDKPENEKVAKCHGATISIDEKGVNYLEVVPEGAPELSIQCKDFVLTASWTKFSAYSPNSDFQQTQPHYTELAEKSKTAARKLYKLLQEKRALVETLSWDGFDRFLVENGVARDMHFSQWT